MIEIVRLVLNEQSVVSLQLRLKREVNALPLAVFALHLIETVLFEILGPLSLTGIPDSEQDARFFLQRLHIMVIFIP